MTAEQLARAICIRMREIDSDITKSLYAPTAPADNQDRPPEGNDYNLLWDALLQEMSLIPNFDPHSAITQPPSKAPQTKRSKTLMITVEATDQQELESLIGQLARSACDIANSESEQAHIHITDPDNA